MIKSEYNYNRAILGLRCSEALDLQPIPPILYEYAVKASDIPVFYEDGYGKSFPESSLLSMGVVYSYGTTMTFIDASGHTYFIPCNDIFKSELEKCGYVICKYGKSSPDFSYPMKREGMTGYTVDIISPDYPAACKKEEAARNKVTLPSELANKVAEFEFSQIEMYDNYPYDVFNPELYRGHQFSHVEGEVILEALGFDNPVSRKFMALSGYACQSLSHLPVEVDNLEKFILYASKHPVLNDSYFKSDGIYEQLTGQNSKKVK
ncbi:MAG: hypothetical protein E7166_00335 [Firmicutes bacterium]|nr:hypothetical protein [Bacillota bacterium]